MTVQLLCPGCERNVHLSLPAPEGPWRCPHCSNEYPTYPTGAIAEGKPIVRCLVCASERFYTQRDFNQRIGCIIAGVGAALSPFTYGISLLVCLVIDLGLYFMLSEATVCYRCGSVYRRLPKNPEHGPFDLHVADVVMNESKYL